MSPLFCDSCPPRAGSADRGVGTRDPVKGRTAATKSRKLGAQRCGRWVAVIAHTRVSLIGAPADTTATAQSTGDPLMPGRATRAARATRAGSSRHTRTHKVIAGSGARVGGRAALAGAIMWVALGCAASATTPGEHDAGLDAPDAAWAPPDAAAASDVPDARGPRSDDVSCDPVTCAEARANCGAIADGCGGTLECGTCDAPERCGGGGMDNICGCTPRTCEDALAECGTVVDGCGGTLECGTCDAPDSCGGGGVSNQCGAAACVPVTCEEVGAECGNISNGCDGTIRCGGCRAPELCGAVVANRCACPASGCGLQWTAPGDSYVLTVPPSVTSIGVTMWGAGGAGGAQVGATGGGGAAIEATVPVRSGDTITAYVAEGGSAPGNGGGASYLFRNSTLLLVAAGGGGGGSDGCSGCASGGRGGAGGASVGQDGADLSSGFTAYCTSATGGRGGTQGAGGQGGTTSGAAPYQCNGRNGAANTGGAAEGLRGACTTNDRSHWRGGHGQGNGGGGGGGSGYFGGGGAGFIWTYCSGGGGGGSSYVHPSLAGASTVYPGSWQVPGNESDPDRGGAGGGGGRNAAGRHGKVLLSW